MPSTKKSAQAQPPPKGRDAGVRFVIVAGDATRAEVLHARLAPVVNRLVWIFLGADADRDDLAHDIFIKLLRGASSVRDPAKLEGWAIRVTMNSIKNEFRRRKLRRFLSLDPADDPGTLRYHPDFEGRELLLHTQRLLEALPIAERVPFTLRLVEGASAEQIAQLGGYSLRTVKRRLKSARQRFMRLAQHDPLVGPRLARSASSSEEADD